MHPPYDGIALPEPDLLHRCSQEPVHTEYHLRLKSRIVLGTAGRRSWYARELSHCFIMVTTNTCFQKKIKLH